MAVGALCGTTATWLLQAGVVAWGPIGALPALAVLIAAIFFQLLGWFPIAINRAFMLYFTVMAAPLLQLHERFLDVVAVVALATVYFGGIVILGRHFIARRHAKAAAA